MDTDVVIWIVITVVVVALLAALAYVLTKRTRDRKRIEAHERAEQLRHEAAQHQPAVQQSDLEARKAEAEAKLRRAEAEHAEAQAAEARQAAAATAARQEDVVREADQLDPAIDHRSSDYRPEVPDARHRENGTTAPSTPTEGPGDNPTGGSHRSPGPAS